MASASAPSNLPIIYRIGDRPATHNFAWRWIWRIIVRRVDHFVAVSEFIAKELEQLHVSRDRITVIYNAPTVRAKPPRPSCVASNPQHILFIGQLTPDKGVDCLVDAFRIIAPEFPAASLTIVGPMPDTPDAWQCVLRDRVLADSALSQRVHFVGEKEDVYTYLASSAFLVVPSLIQEALSNVVGEAKASARPSVIFPRGGLPELVNHGEDGFICNDVNVEALADGLRYYLSDHHRTQEHGRAALESLKRLGIHEFAFRWRDLYDRTSTRHFN